MPLRSICGTNRGSRRACVIAIVSAILTAASGCGGGAAKTTAAKHAFAVSKNRITLNKKSTQWPLSYATAKAMLGKPDRTTKVDVIDTTIYTWDKHGITAHQEDGSKDVSITFWFHENAAKWKWCPYDPAKAVVINDVALSAGSDPADLEKAGFRLRKRDKSQDGGDSRPKSSIPQDFGLTLDRVNVTAQYNPEHLSANDYPLGLWQDKGLDSLGVGDE